MTDLDDSEHERKVRPGEGRRDGDGIEFLRRVLGGPFVMTRLRDAVTRGVATFLL